MAPLRPMMREKHEIAIDDGRVNRAGALAVFLDRGWGLLSVMS